MSEEAKVMSSPHAEQPAEWPSDKVDLDELVKDVAPYTGGAEYGIPGFFETDQEHDEFVAWYRAEREKELT